MQDYLPYIVSVLCALISGISSYAIARKQAKNDIKVIVRGLRAVTDFEYELQIAQSNRQVAPDIDTVFLTTNIQYSYLSSSIVKEYASFGVDVGEFVPNQVRDALIEKYSK